MPARAIANYWMQRTRFDAGCGRAARGGASQFKEEISRNMSGNKKGNGTMQRRVETMRRSASPIGRSIKKRQRPLAEMLCGEAELPELLSALAKAANLMPLRAELPKPFSVPESIDTWMEAA